MSKQQKIVVGIEGSGGARAALKWAIQEAKFRNATVVVATCYSSKYVMVAQDFTYIPTENFNVEEEVDKMQRRLAEEVIAESDCENVPIEYVKQKGGPVDSLIEIAEDADLLVIGSRGRGGFKGLLLGSVSQQIASHGKCPVVIVRPDLEVEVETVEPAGE